MLRLNSRKSKVVKVSRFLLVFVLITGWIFSGWPQVLDFYFNGEYLKFPSEIQETQAATERKSPDGLLQQDNLSGAVTDIDEDPDTPGTDWLTYIAAGTDTVARVSFPMPTGSLTVGAGLQEFKIWVRRAFVGVAKTPTVRIELYENGVSKATVLADTNVTNDTGILLSGTWDANLLGTADGSLVECYIYGTVSVAGSNKSMIEVGAVEWNVDYNISPTLSISQPDGVSDTVTVGDSYNITYTLADTDDTVTAAFSYDTDNTGLDGTAITGACATAAEGSGATCSWDTTGMTPGSYYVYGITNDGVNPQVSAYSPGQITILSTTILIRNVADTADVSTITFPAGDPSAIISNPTGNGDVQVLTATASEAAPVAILKSATAYKLWYNVTSVSGWGDAVASEKLYTQAIAAALDLTTFGSSAYNMTVWDTDQATTTQELAAGVDEELFLQVTLSALWGKTGTSTLSVLGEAL